MTLHGAINAPLRIKEGGPETVLGQLETCIREWAVKDMESDARGEWRRKWKLWKVFFDLGNDQMRSLLASALLWMGIVLFLTGYWIVSIG